MILNAIAAKLKSRSKADFKGRHFEAALIVQAVSCTCATRSRHTPDADGAEHAP